MGIFHSDRLYSSLCLHGDRFVGMVSPQTEEVKVVASAMKEEKFLFLVHPYYSEASATYSSQLENEMV